MQRELNWKMLLPEMNSSTCVTHQIIMALAFLHYCTTCAWHEHWNVIPRTEAGNPMTATTHKVSRYMYIRTVSAIHSKSK